MARTGRAHEFVKDPIHVALCFFRTLSKVNSSGHLAQVARAGLPREFVNDPIHVVKDCSHTGWGFALRSSPALRQK